MSGAANVINERDIQALQSAISRRDWNATETAANSIRDKLHRQSGQIPPGVFWSDTLTDFVDSDGLSMGDEFWDCWSRKQPWMFPKYKSSAIALAAQVQS